MSQQVICDSCGEPIDRATEASWVVSVQKLMVPVEGQGPPAMLPTVMSNFDYHEDHLPEGLKEDA